MKTGIEINLKNLHGIISDCVTIESHVLVLYVNVFNTIVYSFQKDMEYDALTLRDVIDIHVLTR